ncbi:hypothetical protein ABHZ30_07220, partial [Bacteroides uniformis]
EQNDLSLSRPSTLHYSSEIHPYVGEFLYLSKAISRKNHFTGHTSPFCSYPQSSNKVFPLFQRNRVLVKTRR